MHLNAWKTRNCLLGGFWFMSPQLPLFLFNFAWLQGPSYGNQSILNIPELKSFLACKWFPLLLPCFKLYWRFAAIIWYSGKFLMFRGYARRSEAGHSLRTRCMRIYKLALSLIIYVFIKIRSSGNVSLVLIMSISEWGIRLSILYGILFGLDLQVWRFLRTFILNLHKESFYVPAMRLLGCMRSS